MTESSAAFSWKLIEENGYDKEAKCPIVKEMHERMKKEYENEDNH